MSKNKERQHTGQDQQGEGRLYNSTNKIAEDQGSKEDISRVDQQEGAMNNGEEGGNFRGNVDQDGATDNR